MQISTLDGRIRFLLGDISVEQLKEKTLFTYRDVELNLALAEMTVSNNNQRAKQIERTLVIDSLDYRDLPDDFFQAIWCELVDAQGYRADYVEIVNLVELGNRDASHLAIAFWGSDPVRYRLSWRPQANVVMRIVYEPSDEHAKQRSQSLEVRDLFAWKIAVETAVNVLPFAEIENKDAIRMSLCEPRGLRERWRTSWEKEMFRSPSQGPVYARPFS